VITAARASRPGRQRKPARHFDVRCPLRRCSRH
jgi:hypothetical protein